MGGRTRTPEGVGPTQAFYGLTTLSAPGVTVKSLSLQNVWNSYDISGGQSRPEAEAFASKVAHLKMHLWGPFDNWVSGNEGADALADLGHDLPPVVEAWTLPACCPEVVVFDAKGRVVDGNLRKKTLKNESAKWANDMRLKPVRGAPLRDQAIDSSATHGALGRSPLPKIRRMHNFLHKARYGMLPVKNTKHHYYWHRGPGGLPVAADPPAEVRTCEPRLNKWLARQIEYKSQLCDLCDTGCRETATHALTDECPHGRSIATATGADIQGMIQASATKGGEYVTHLPLWFPAGDTPHGVYPCVYGPFDELKAFNTYWGALGYVPKSLHKALDYFGVVDKKLLITQIAQRVATGAFKRWGSRCSTTADNAARHNATRAARERVDRGVG